MVGDYQGMRLMLIEATDEARAAVNAYWDYRAATEFRSDSPVAFYRW
jgi:hypothetical protein